MRLLRLHDRLIVDVLSGVFITCRRDRGEARITWSLHSGAINHLRGDEALAAIDAVEEVLAAQDAALPADESRWNGALLGARLGCLEDAQRLTSCPAGGDSGAP